jgi:hypothetical protein
MGYQGLWITLWDVEKPWIDAVSREQISTIKIWPKSGHTVWIGVEGRI